jgi:hypothetical protein
MQANGHKNHQGQVATGLFFAIKIGARKCIFFSVEVKVSYCVEYYLLPASIF